MSSKSDIDRIKRAMNEKQQNGKTRMDDMWYFLYHDMREKVSNMIDKYDKMYVIEIPATNVVQDLKTLMEKERDE